MLTSQRTLKKYCSLVLFVTLLFYASCRKTDSLQQAQEARQKTEQFYNNTSQLDPVLTGLVNSFKKQVHFNSQLEAFIEKNGVPKWDRTIYRTKSRIGNSPEQGSVKTNGIKTNGGNNTDTGSQALFLVPLVSTSTGEVKSYITAYKHNDSLYSYRLYNKDSLNSVHPKSKKEKQDLLNTMAVIGVFEKDINNKESIDVNTTKKGKIKQPSITLGDEPSQGNHNQYMLPSGGSCYAGFIIQISYEYLEIGDNYVYYEYGSITAMVFVEFDCGGGGGGGFDYIGDPGGTGGGGGEYWYDYGTGYPYSDPGGPSSPGDGQWQFWFTGGGGGGGLTEIVADPATLGNFDDLDNTYRDDNTTITFDANSGPFPTIANVLTKADFVPYDGTNCLDLARLQIGKASVTDLGYGSAFKTYTESTGVNATDAKNGVDYVITKLAAGKPVMVAVDNRAGTPSTKNLDGSTDHFITIVGSGHDSGGDYFTFFDNASNLPSKGASSANKLYYDHSTGMISGHSDANGYIGPGSPYHDYIVTQIRKNS